MPFCIALRNLLTLLLFFFIIKKQTKKKKLDIYYTQSQRTQSIATSAQDRTSCWIILHAYLSVLPCKRPWQKAQSCQGNAGWRGCWVVLCLNYLLAASVGTMVTVAQTRESPRTALNWVTARRRKRERCWYRHADEVPSLFSWGQKHPWPQQSML